MIAPVLILLIVITFDIGFVVNERMSMESAALTAARYVVQGGDPDNINSEVVPLLELSDPDSFVANSQYICECDDGEVVDCSGSCGGTGYMRRFIDIETSIDHVLLFPYPGFPDELEIQGGARIQVE